MYWFCHTSTWICHGFTRGPHPEPPSHLPPHMQDSKKYFFLILQVSFSFCWWFPLLFRSFLVWCIHLFIFALYLCIFWVRYKICLPKWYNKAVHCASFWMFMVSELKKIYLFICLCLVLVAACGIFSCIMWDLVSWTVIEPEPPTLGLQSLSHSFRSYNQVFNLFLVHFCICCIVDRGSGLLFACSCLVFSTSYRKDCHFSLYILDSFVLLGNTCFDLLLCS